MSNGGNITDQKRIARRAYKAAKAVLSELKQKIREAKDKTIKSALRAGLPAAEARIDSARVEWKQLVERERLSRVPRKPRQQAAALRELPVPEPKGFEWVKRPRDFYRQVIDPNWKPNPSQCVMLGKYVFASFHEGGGVEALIRIRVPGDQRADAEVRTMVVDYFEQKDALVYWGKVRVLDIERDTRPYHRDKYTIRIRTDHRRVKGLIHPSNGVYGGPYQKERGGQARVARPAPGAAPQATTADTLQQRDGKGKP